MATTPELKTSITNGCILRQSSFLPNEKRPKCPMADIAPKIINCRTAADVARTAFQNGLLGLVDQATISVQCYSGKKSEVPCGEIITTRPL